MDKWKLHDQLFELTENEKYYAAHEGASSPRFALAEKVSIRGKKALRFPLENLDANGIIIRKDSRFISMPFYLYDNININFIYSGECIYWIDGTELVLHKGDVCIFDKGAVRAKKRTGYNDIIINFNISDQRFQQSVPRLEDQNIISTFLLSSLLSNSDHDNYIVFQTNEDERITSLFDHLLVEYYDNRPYSKEIIQNYLAIIVLELLRLYQVRQDIHLIHLPRKTYNQALEILYYIETHYADCTLKGVANHFGYHEKYLCAYIKKNTGKTLREIRRDYRLKNAAYFLTNTTLPIHEISERIGYTNRNQFYHEFKDAYQMLPAEYRKRTAKDEEDV